jgi:hypothetical protein
MGTSHEQPPADMLQAIERCSVQCDGVLSELTATVSKQVTARWLYHYTDGPGLWGILESGHIRLTDIFGLNDPSELRHGIRHACRVLAAEAKNGHPAAKVFANRFRHALASGAEELAEFFVACFSHDGDELGQWRAYGDNGRGFALEFDGQLIEQGFIQQKGVTASRSTFPILYLDTDLRSLCRRLAQFVIPVTALPQGRNLSNGAINEFMKQLSIVASYHAVHSALYFKHEAYKSEREFRLLEIHSANATIPGLRYRARTNSLKRYTEFPWMFENGSALRGIVIGPAADHRHAKAFVRDCLKKTSGDELNLKIRRSTIPYRS